jgi:competence protein ComEC
VIPWLFPLCAVAFWTGLVAAPRIGSHAPIAAWLVLGGVVVAVAAAAGGRREDLPYAARLVDPRFEPAPVSVVTARRAAGGLPPGVVLALVLAGVGMLGVGWGGVARARVARSPLLAAAPRVVVVEGQLRTDPALSDHGWSAILDVRHASWAGTAYALREAVWISGDEPPPAVRGDRLQVTGPARIPDDAGFAAALERRGIAVEVRGERVSVLGGASDPLVRGAQAFRAFVGRSIRRLFPQPEAGLLLGLALGDDSRLDEGLARDFHATGLGHLLVVSGENVAMVLAPILGLALWLRLGKWPTFLLGGGTVVFFVVLTGAEPSVMRAGVMAGLTLVGVLLGRPRSTAAVLAGAVMILLVLDPTLVWAIGFQLSVVATGGMIAMATPIADRIGFLPRSIAVAAGATVAAQLAVTPVLLFHFHEVPVVTIVANVLAFPAVSPALLLGLLAGGTGVVSPTIARPIAALAVLPMRYLELLADRLAKAPVAWITSSGGIGVLVLGGAVVGAVAWSLRGRRRIPRLVVVLAVAAMPLLVWATALSSGPPSHLAVHFFDVGQGDAALVASPGGANVLIDAGPDEEEVATKLAALGVKRVDVAVATHPHADHVDGFPAVFARFPVGLVLEPGCDEPSPSYARFLESVRDEGLRVEHPRTGDRYIVGDLTLDVLAPDACVHGTDSDPNNDSVVLRVAIEDDVVLFPGDSEEPSQQTMLDEGAALQADVLKVPHHGGATSLHTFFEAVGADLAVVSVGQPNDYGHPVAEILDEIVATGAEIHRTDREGDVTVEFSRQGLLIASAA